MKCLFGIYREDGGDILLKGRRSSSQRKDALEAGVSMIHQELSNVPSARSARTSGWPRALHRIGPWKFLNHRKMHTTPRPS